MMATGAYCLAFLVKPTTTWPGPIQTAMRTLSGHMLNVVDRVLSGFGTDPVPFTLRIGLYLVMTSCLIPWLIMALLRRGRPRGLGCRRPNRYGWRLLIIAYLISIPFLVWMKGGSRFAEPYLHQLDLFGGVPFCFYYAINMLTEHFFLHGVVLAAFRKGGRWPAPVKGNPTTGSGCRRALQWAGLAQPTGGAHGLVGLTRSIGLPDGCLTAILGSAALFGLVHVGKEWRELVLSVPGGMALAYLAYRTNTWLMPFVLHLITAGTALAMIILAR